MSDEQPSAPDPGSTASPEASSAPPPQAQAAPQATPPAAPAEGGDRVQESQDATDQAAIDELLKQASFEDVPAAATAPPGVAPPPLDAAPIDLPTFQQVMQEAQVSSIDLLRDVELNVKIELGRSRMLVEDVLKLAEGSVVELDKLAGDPVDVFVNDRLVARGEVLVLNDNFCVRVNEIVAGAKEEGV
ncbi:flagellar motor switch protein FliN [Fontivita pretiosa]|uniref:flagellar motor switch protein FliN n=1 Tax=Fontivita pretiosa TaxID=2989684 RepID=UPI003D177967